MAQPSDQPVSHARILRIALPIMVSNVTEPLIGVVNTAVVGRLGDAALIGGVAVGALVFSFLFWGFGFLRLSTSGMAAQATGARNPAELSAIFWRSLLLALAIGMVLVMLSAVIKPLAISLMGGSAEVQQAASIYFSYRILAAPAALANFPLLGWFIGQGRTQVALATQLTLNLTNMGLSALFVLHFDMGIAGVGASVLVAEYAGAALGLVLVLRRMKQLDHVLHWPQVLQRHKLLALLSANADMMIRTICLLFAFAWFTARGARQGNTVVAANAVLMHMFEVAAYLIDGFAYAAEALVGQAIGARDRSAFRMAIRLSALWTMLFGTLAGLCILLAGHWMIDAMTINAEVRGMARQFLPWAAATPVLGAACFLFDGIFTGALATRDMRNMMVLSLAVFMAGWWWLEAGFGNAGLWAALCLFLLARSISFAARLPAITQRAFG